MRSRTFPWSAPLFAIALCCFTGQTWAQNDGSAIKDASDIVFNEGVDLASKGQYAEAAERFRKAITLRDTLGARIELAKCYEALGKVASALEQWQHVYVETSKDADSTKAQRRKKLAAEAIPKLEKRLSGITLEVPDRYATLPGFLIKLDQAPVAAVRWGERIPADIGEHHLEVVALDKVPWRLTIVVHADKENVSLRIDPGWETSGNGTDGSRSTTGSSALRIGGGVGIGLGVIGVGLSSTFGGLAIMRNNASKEGHCDAQDRCDRTGYQLRKDALSFASVSTATAIVGAASLAAGIAMIAIAPAKTPSKQGRQTRFWVGPSGVGVAGTF